MSFVRADSWRVLTQGTWRVLLQSKNVFDLGGITRGVTPCCTNSEDICLQALFLLFKCWKPLAKELFVSPANNIRWRHWYLRYMDACIKKDGEISEWLVIQLKSVREKLKSEIKFTSKVFYRCENYDLGDILGNESKENRTVTISAEHFVYALLSIKTWCK